MSGIHTPTLIRRCLSRRAAPLAAALLSAVLIAPLTPGHVSAATTNGYWLPFVGGSTYKITQGWCGTFSHKLDNGTCVNAYDFGMTTSTYIAAAAPGKVVRTKTTGVNNGGVCDAKYVIVELADGTWNLYWHLSTVRVSVGQNVGRGQVLGNAGTTGASTGVHLHFQVDSTHHVYCIDGKVDPGVKFYFYEYPNQQFAVGKAYKSENFETSTEFRRSSPMRVDISWENNATDTTAFIIQRTDSTNGTVTVATITNMSVRYFGDSVSSAIKDYKYRIGAKTSFTTLWTAWAPTYSGPAT
jgi:murein DD-endopeptidase MepM/ murein hydrolase activator NlpD